MHEDATPDQPTSTDQTDDVERLVIVRRDVYRVLIPESSLLEDDLTEIVEAVTGGFEDGFIPPEVEITFSDGCWVKVSGDLFYSDPELVLRMAVKQVAGWRSHR